MVVIRSKKLQSFTLNYPLEQYAQFINLKYFIKII
ncbi:hypothetical protein ViNHUV68_23580 [Vibrio sp. NH-UV-68]